MPNICLVFWKYEPQYAYKRYAYKKKTCIRNLVTLTSGCYIKNGANVEKY